MKKILLITNVFPYKKERLKAGTYVESQVSCLRKLGFSFEIATSNSLSKKLVKYPLLASRTLFKALKRFDLIHCHNTFPPGTLGLLVKKITGKPLVITSHGSDINVMPNKSKFIKKIIIRTLKGADKIIAVSEQQKETISKLGIEKSKIAAIPCGVDSGIFKKRNKQAVRKKLGLKDEFTVLFAGPFGRIKNTDLILDSFYKANLKNSKLIMVGEGERLSANMASALKLGLDVSFPGWIPLEKLAEYMNAADVLVLASEREGFGLVIIEALMSGTPVISTKTGAGAEKIGGIVNFDLKKKGDLIAKLKQAYKKMPKIDEKALQRYSSECACRRVKEVYDSLIKN